MKGSNWVNKMRSVASCLLVVPALILSLPVFAADYVASEDVIEEVITVGVRSPGRVASSSPVPVDAFSSDTLKSTGQAEVGRMLQAVAPSFNFSSSSISDGTDALRPATLRGLGPDQTLVLVNGKRRHISALLHINTSVGRGTAGTDLNAIPGIAIKRIEVLRDGASAQYGSDAIAGVINLVLKDGTDGGETNFHYGQYNEGDGETLVINTNYGWEIGNDGSLNVALERRTRGSTNRAGLSGQCQFSCMDAMLDGQMVMQTTDQREIDFNRKNFRVGDAESEQLAAVINLDIPIGESNFYLFSTYSNRDNESGGFYRRANQADRNPTLRSDGTTQVNSGNAFIELGFLPLINTDITDFSVDTGITGHFGEWNWDLSFGYANNTFDHNITNSLNASLVSDTGTSPRSAYAGRLAGGLVTAQFDAYRPTNWGSFAFGSGYKYDQYEIRAGEELSWQDYDTNADGISGAANGAAGIQVFPGFRPENAVDEGRQAVFGYVDVEWNISEALLVTGAGRFEDYSDFGSTVNVKGAFALKVGEPLLLRGAASTGFRAPSLQQRYFSSVSTQFVTDSDTNMIVANEVGTFRNDSELAQALGIPSLKEETSLNFSLGLVWEPTDILTFSADVYRIDITDRIVISGQIGGTLDPVVVAPALARLGVSRAQFFLNAADTRTTGIDLVASLSPELPRGLLDITLSANVTSTKITDVTAPSDLSTIAGINETLFTAQDRSIITEWQPNSRVSLLANYVVDNWNFFAGLQNYGKYTVLDGSASQTFSAKSLVDASIGYTFGSGVTIKAGGNNIFGTLPDVNTIGQSRSGVIIDGDNNVVIDSPGVFQYSRRSAPFGFNGAYFYFSLGLEY